MQIIELTKEQFDEFAIKHKNHNFYQTSQYGALMNRNGFVDFYVGLLDENNALIGASLILVQKKLGRFKVGYAPRGFLIDFNDLNLVDNFSKLLREYLFHQGFIYVRIDPCVIHIERDNKGNPLSKGINNDFLIDHLKKNNYTHRGFNLYFENLTPRWNAITKLNASSEKLFASFSKEIRNKIRRSYKRGVTIYKGTRNDLKMFYNLVGKKHSRKLGYYLDYYEIFSKNNMFEIYFAKVDPAVYIRTSKDLYEHELKHNGDITSLIQSNKNNRLQNHYINMKMNSDKLLDIYKTDIINANNLFRSYPNGVVIAASAIIKFDKEIFFLIDGYDQKFKTFCANHLMKWAIINEYSKKGYLYAHNNGIAGNFDKYNPYYGLYLFKRGFNSEIVEYIGEFDLVINKQMYQACSQVPFLWKMIGVKKYDK